MKRPILITIMIIALAALACVAPPVPITPGPIESPTASETAVIPTETPIDTVAPPTASLTPSATATAEPSPSATASATPDESPTPTPIVPGPIEPPNLLSNGGFEAPYIQQADYNNHFVAHGWEDYACEYPWLPEPSAEFPDPVKAFCDDRIALPEYKQMRVADYPYRVYAGQSAQNWFCFYRKCRAGVYQVFDAPTGYECRASVYVQSWSSPEDAGQYSRLLSQDDRDNHHWRLKVSLTGDDFPFAEEHLVSRDFGFADGIYDKYVLIWFDFTAGVDPETLFIEAENKWAFQHNDWHVDNASVQCWPEGERPAPPGDLPEPQGYARFNVTVNVRGGPGEKYEAFAAIRKGETVSIYETIVKDNEAATVWIRIDPYQAMWAALRYAGTCYAQVWGENSLLPCLGAPPTPVPEIGYTMQPILSAAYGSYLDAHGAAWNTTGQDVPLWECNDDPDRPGAFCIPIDEHCEVLPSGDQACWPKPYWRAGRIAAFLGDPVCAGGWKWAHIAIDAEGDLIFAAPVNGFMYLPAVKLVGKTNGSVDEIMAAVPAWAAKGPEAWQGPSQCQ